MKWIGVLLLLCATTYVGFDISKRLSDRPRQIRQLKNALQVLEAEIVYGQSPIQQVFGRLSTQLPKPLNGLFAHLYQQLNQHQFTLYDVWRKSLDKFWPHFAMKNPEKEIMDQFGQTLGQHDFTQQRKHIYLALSHLDRELENAEDESRRYGKMAKSLGLLTGLFLVLLLI
ncbi:stage III sporulation protein SpoIIIAB [Salirhabdus salicampi]|uniref:stage III sporulation protein SpoIIIAB n=1 Tax=Salirhabdus salicampi TaxID=476102 RepID=UPI0020C43471|nr:stage III sporulation protein SpoIIIAB [Salirhabdus salicampi]MCP8616826.1 stage III sporulation protein SpoIIIAB [Salirhabdus salicampi]